MSEKEPRVVTGMRDDHFEALLTRAAEEGARRALAQVGLHDDTAAKDVSDLRGLLDAWRDVVRTGRQTAIKAIVTLILGALMAGLGLKLWGMER